MNTVVDRTIEEFVTPLAIVYVKGFDVKRWLETRPDVKEALSTAETEYDALKVFKTHLKPYLEEHEGEEVAVPKECACSTYPALHDKGEYRALEVTEVCPVTSEGGTAMMVYMRPINGQRCKRVE